MAEQSTISTGSDPPPFDPTEPSTPIAFPIKTLEDLESRAYFKSFHYPFNKSTVALQPLPLPDRRRMLVCHDMAGGYKDDKWVQGGTNPDAFGIWHWYLIDVFVYFSHDLVTLPPPCWTNTAHRHGVKVLGTFILEGGGKDVRDTLLLTKESAQMYAERLTELTIALGFDGWLMNMEISLNSHQIPHMKEFVSHLTRSMHSKLPGSLVIWYDSVTIDGKLDWQNQLNERNKPFFDICDGIYVNYGWKEDTPKNSAAAAGERKYDVYMGIDVFGRGTYGGGEWHTNVALDLLRKDDVSAAVFAPGWVYEHEQETDFQTAQNKWWNLVKKSWGLVQSYPKLLPFYSNFDQGHGHHVSIDGEQISDASWNNLSSQGFQPILDVTDASTSHSIQAYLNFKEVYNGGGSIALEGTLEQNCYTEIRLFRGELVLGEDPLICMYSSQLNGDSQVGLSLEFLSNTNKRKLLLTSSIQKQFSNDFSEVIETTPLEAPRISPHWSVQVGRIQMNGYKLTNINILCYRSSLETTEPKYTSELDKNNTLDRNSSSKYFAVLGSITLRTCEEPDLPPSDSWIVESPYTKWTPSPEGTRTLDIKITWKLKDSSNHTVMDHYNVYVVKVAEGCKSHVDEIQNVPEYLGVAHVEAFYVSNLAVHSSTSRLKFMIQVCGVDGSSHRLEDSPFLYLDIEVKSTPS
ncbi:cytosolic endo-beta-N-acetylglucosaminidase 1 isoform X2 [Cucumis sativus]|uniref:cytosolic endo-beta-N-acetylglucosaminidase 1 isoform X2 n=1 Tax=Cucumis sativus TaxID=3659 RepID=UPI0005EC5DC5|nr:cytosolic endo-beta-N-acetylglucosaminidase 1 isoform X2 [Cucumis sativus]